MFWEIPPADWLVLMTSTGSDSELPKNINDLGWNHAYRTRCSSSTSRISRWRGAPRRWRRPSSVWARTCAEARYVSYLVNDRNFQWTKSTLCNLTFYIFKLTRELDTLFICWLWYIDYVGRMQRTKTCLSSLVQSNPLNGSPDNGSIWLSVQVLAGPILILAY